jgi:riboflavin synthase
MFTGIIESVGTIKSLRSSAADMRIELEVGELDMTEVKLGDSIAVNGVCLTVTQKSAASFCADISAESLRYTCFGELKAGASVNLEKALTLSTPLGGHLVSGHVDGIGSIVEIGREGKSWRYTVTCPKELAPYVAAKGSIAIDGVSLTVTDLTSSGFKLNIVPHTSGNTIIPGYTVGQRVHIEVDMMARYAERLLQTRFKDSAESSGAKVISREFLAQNGFKV